MSLYIPGLAAPKDGCKSCMFDVYGQCLIKANLDKPWELTHSCPLIEVPPHGRLGDLDDLEERIKICKETAQNDDFDLGVIWYSAFSEMAAWSPTIIPADGADKEET